MAFEVYFVGWKWVSEHELVNGRKDSVFGEERAPKFGEEYGFELLLHMGNSSWCSDGFNPGETILYELDAYAVVSMSVGDEDVRKILVRN